MVIDEKLKEVGVSNIKYYYKNCPIMGNIFTVCLFFSKDNKILSRGVAICSVNDSHNKIIAREKSKSRAIAAIYKKASSLEINSYETINESQSIERITACQIKTFKIKKNKKELLEELVALINNHIYALDYYVKIFEDFDVLCVEIPYTAPMEITRKYFQYKSEFNPVPTKDEVKMFKL